MATSGSSSWLVAPESMIHRIRSLVALVNFVDARNIDSKMAGNLRELLSFAAVGSDRLMRRRAAGVRC